MQHATVTIAGIDRATRCTALYKQARHLQLAFRTPDGRKHFWIVPGWPEIQIGMTVTAVLERPPKLHRSNRVLGWMRHETGDVILADHPLRPTAGAGLFAALGMGALDLYSISPELSSLTSWLPAGIFLACAVASAIVAARAVVVRARLRKLGALKRRNEKGQQGS